MNYSHLSIPAGCMSPIQPCQARTDSPSAGVLPEFHQDRGIPIEHGVVILLETEKRAAGRPGCEEVG
jgi:hypothetical protein